MKRKGQTARKGWLIVVLALLMLACNLPLESMPTPIVPPTRSIEIRPTDDVSAESGSADLVPTVTLRPTESVPTPITTSQPTIPLPTATPTQPSTIIPPTATPVLAPTATPRAAATSVPQGAPLELNYKIDWRLDPSNANMSIAAVELYAAGGGGNYTFYRDQIPTGGSKFEYFWGICQENPGKFRVDSGDGQSLEVEYFQQSSCP